MVSDWLLLAVLSSLHYFIYSDEMDGEEALKCFYNQDEEFSKCISLIDIESAKKGLVCNLNHRELHTCFMNVLSGCSHVSFFKDGADMILGVLDNVCKTETL